MESANRREDQPDALAEGRRIYLGNLLYYVKPQEIEEALTEHGFGDYTQIHLSVDPVSGRNPGYCFVDFEERATAENAIASLSATIRGRPLKVGPCRPKEERRTGRWGRDGERDRDRNGDGAERQTAFQRWGNWKRSDAEPSDRPQPPKDHGPYAALDHFENVFERQQSNRLYIGGLGKMVDQEQNNDEIRTLLAGYEPTAVGKRVTAHPTPTPKPGNHNYCFVDFATPGEAEQVINALNGKPYNGDRLRVSHARGSPEGWKQKGPELRYVPRVTTTDDPSFSKLRRKDYGVATGRALESSSWRRQD
ncbi:nucleic acid-binding protein [Grosmannia clavigera kw1407]|uniref:Nucleic acid-binding protein n=1 Tax=Grosmannia clavigera (strain kw1407 / UAMH 11150) TaxID=655863 RepID=F0XET5_GROCL|nr:nucleic acid-binding protein [Grosmannia clavigera kw1407]EFX04518.1 nucleic acid-binding protein [Grosmannia clavigera kw1407]